MNSTNIETKIFRFNPLQDTQPYFDTYTVPYREGMTITSLLRYVYEELDPTLAFRYYRCGRGFCSHCRVKVNGKTVKACSTILTEGQDVIIEPANINAVIRDLVVITDSSIG
jgi:succinate dehydrogenase/fumarate reductase-like Fe-S protein